MGGIPLNNNATRKIKPNAKPFAALAAACVTGFAGSLCCDPAFGSLFGIMTMCACIILFIYAFFGNKKSMTYEAIPAAVIMGGLTFGTYGSLFSQVGGMLPDGSAGEEFMMVNPWSGLIITVLAGIGLMPLFNIFTASLFAKKKIGTGKYVLVLLIFCGAALLFKFVVSHFIMKYLCPDATEYFESALAQNGEAMSAMKAYASKFGLGILIDEIPFGRNYFMCVQAISYAIAGIAASVAAGVIFGSGFTAFVSAGMDIICGIGFAVSGLLTAVNAPDGVIGKLVLPGFLEFSETVASFIGFFIIGLGIMLIFLNLPRTINWGEGKFRYQPTFKNSGAGAAYASVFNFAFFFGAIFSRPVAYHAAVKLAEEDIIDAEKADAFMYLLMACVIAVVFAISAIMMKTNFVSKGLPVPVPARAEDFSSKILPVYFLVIVLAAFFSGSGFFFAVPIEEMTNASPETLLSRESGDVLYYLVLILAAVLFYVFYIVAQAICSSKKKVIHSAEDF